MKKQNQNPVATVLKLFIAPLQLVNFLSLIIFFAFGFCFGIILTFHLKNLSFDLQFTQFSLSTTTPTPPHPLQSPPPPLQSPPPPRQSPPPLTTTKIGLTEYIHPSNVMHNMTDEQLLWRASMVPKVSEFPFERVPKVAFMFLTRQSVLLAPLWDKFFKGHEGLYNIYVHTSDSSSNGIEPRHSVFHGRRIPSKDVEWGKANMIEAERRLLANALLDFSNQRFVLLSEACIPLFNFSTVYSYLINSTNSFVESYDLAGPVGRGRYNHKMYPTISLLDWRKGSQWFEMDRDLAIEVISDQTYFPVFQNYCDGSCYADEHYLPTFVTMRFGVRNSNRTLTWVDWSKGGPHPNKFRRYDVSKTFLEKLRGESGCEYNGKGNQTCFMFARKFLPHALDRLLRFAPKVMHFNP